LTVSDSDFVAIAPFPRAAAQTPLKKAANRRIERVRENPAPAPVPLFRGSSAVEQSAVNRSVRGSNPRPGANKIKGLGGIHAADLLSV
jgi:hypothetical protein